MKRNLFIIMILAVALVFGISCSTVHDLPSDEGNVIEGECSNYRYRIVSDGSELVIEIEGNPTTGYSWKPEQDDDWPVSIDTKEYVQNDLSGMVGVGGNFRFVLSARQSGSADLSFTYTRTFSGETAAKLVISVEIDSNLDISVTSVVF